MRSFKIIWPIMLTQGIAVFCGRQICLALGLIDIQIFIPAGIMASLVRMQAGKTDVAIVETLFPRFHSAPKPSVRARLIGILEMPLF